MTRRLRGRPSLKTVVARVDAHSWRFSLLGAADVDLGILVMNTAMQLGI